MKNTAIQEAINKIDTLIAMWQEPSNEMDFEHTLITYKYELESLLEKEKQDLIDAFGYGFDTGINYENQVQGEFSNDIDYYNKTFKQ